MGKLYPPHIEGTLPSFYKNSEKGVVLTIPFSMNRAVSASEVYGYSLRVKDVINGEELFTVNTYDHSSMTEVTFKIEFLDALKFVVGSYYKFQLAYIDQNENTGYYSTVGVCKCTARPTVNIEGLNLQINNSHKYSYTGYYNNIDDPTEKVYSYQFILTDKNGNVIADSGKRIHQTEDNAINSYESIDNFNFSSDLEENEAYLLQYIITTNNNMIVKSPKYRIMQMSMTDMTEHIKLVVNSNYDEGCINIAAIYNDNADDIYILDTSNEYVNFLDYYNKEYKSIILNEDTYISNKYYILNNKNEYSIDKSESFDNAKDYYESFYTPVKINETTYEKDKFYIRQEHFIRGNFLISRSCKDTDYKEWNNLATIKIQGYGKEFYNHNDFTVEQGKYYKYSIQQYNNFGTLSKRIMTDEIFASFEDLFLFDGKRQLKVKYNPKVSSFKINKIMTKTDTIGGKYPYIFENASTYYHEFPIAGLISYFMDDNGLFMKPSKLGFNENYDSLIRENTYDIQSLKTQILENIYIINAKQLELDGEQSGMYEFQNIGKINQLKAEIHECYQENNRLREILDKKLEHKRIFDKRIYKTHNLENENIAAERIFKTEVLDWLNNGEPKLFKSPTEGNFIITLMNVSLSPEDGLGRMLHSFSSTAYEIADFTYDNLIKLGIIEKTSLNYNFLLWKTINLSEPRGIDNIDGNYILNENFEAVTLYRGDVEYNCFEILNGVTAYSLFFNNLQPGSIITIDGSDIVIGATGNYYTESEHGFESVLIPENQIYKGSLTYNYYGSTPGEFDLITNETVKSHAGSQFLGNGTNIIENLNNSISKIKDFGYLQFMARDIIEVDLADTSDWDIHYYADQTHETEVIFNTDNIDFSNNIYYQKDENSLGNDYLEVSEEDGLIFGNTYYKNNRYGINPILISAEGLESNYIKTINETFYLHNTNELINTTNNYYPLYKYTTDKIIIDNNIVYLEDNTLEVPKVEITIYKDCYYNKYYIDESVRNFISDAFYKKLLNYGVEILSFNIQLDENTIQVGPNIKHIKVGEQFKQYILIEEIINSSSEFEQIKEEYGEILYTQSKEPISFDKFSFKSLYKKLFTYDNGIYRQVSEFDSYNESMQYYINKYTAVNEYDPKNTKYYYKQDFHNYIFYTTDDCQHEQTSGINENNCEQYYILKEINSIVDNRIEKVFSKKGIFTFNNLTLGNGVVLNCAYQTIDYTYGIENLNNLDDKYYDGKLKYLQNQMNYYYNILSGNYDGDYDFVNLSLNNLDGIIEYYKNSLLEEISEANQDESNDFNNISLIIENYSNFLNIYNSYLLGTITTLTDFKKALGDNLLLLKTINSLINEKIILEEYAKKQYLKYLDEYTIRINQLLKIYKDKESGVE